MYNTFRGGSASSAPSEAIPASAKQVGQFALKYLGQYGLKQVGQLTVKRVGQYGLIYSEQSQFKNSFIECLYSILYQI